MIIQRHIKNWKKVQPTSLLDAIELCCAHAYSKKNKSVEWIAGEMGVASKWTLYKWIANGRIPAILIRPFENACGIDFVTQHLASSDHRLLIDIPTGRKAKELEVSELQGAFSQSMTLLINYHKGAAKKEETLQALTLVMSGLAWHQESVCKSQQPELDLEGEKSE